MKLKGVNPIVQHIEKAVLGLTAIILLAVISMQFVTQPNQVKVGSTEVGPDQIYNELASKANTLQSQITDLSPTLPEVEPVDLVARYNKAFETSEGALAKLSAPLGKGVDVASQLGTPIDLASRQKVEQIEAVAIPASTTPIASSNWGTLDPYAVFEVPQYADYIPATQPFDFPSVSIEADFSGTTLRDVLEGKDGYPGVPRLFWVATGMAVMGLDVERQELQTDGSWSDSKPIAVPPSTPLPTGAVTKDDGLVRLNEIIKSAQSVADEVMRPMFPPTISGPEWKSPSEILGNEFSELTETQRLQRKLEILTTQVNKLKNPQRTTQNTSRPGGAKTGMRGPTDPGVSSGGGSRSNTDRSKKKLEKLEKQIDGIKKDLDRLGVDTSVELETNPDILTQDNIQLWAHDMGVTPGATYRYRTRVILNNPYFRKGPYLDETDEAQQALTIEPFASGKWSDWSDPVDVGAKEFFFVTDAAQPVLGPDLPQAKVELYSMYYGFYRRSSMNITEGQPLLADVRVSGDLVLMDTETITAADSAKYIEELNAENKDLELPDGISSAPDRLSIDLGTFLIQIASNPIPSAMHDDSAGSSLTFRLSDGTLVYRSPAKDSSSQLYDQAQSSSSSATRSQLRPTGQPAKSEAAELFVKTEP